MGEVYLNEKLDVRGQKFSVAVSDRGWFTVRLDGHEVSAETLQELYSKLNIATRRRKLDIHFCKLSSDGGVLPGIVTGVHGGNGNLLVHWSNAKRAVQETAWWETREPRVHPLNFDEIAQWHQLCLDRKAAEKAIADFLEPRKLDLRELAEGAMKDDAP